MSRIRATQACYRKKSILGCADPRHLQPASLHHNRLYRPCSLIRLLRQQCQVCHTSPALRGGPGLRHREGDSLLSHKRKPYSSATKSILPLSTISRYTPIELWDPIRVGWAGSEMSK